MRLTFDDVAEKFRAVLAGDMSREEADRWAADVMKHEDDGSLRYEPTDDEQRIWEGASYLHGIDIKTNEGSYLFSRKDIEAAFANIQRGLNP